MTVTSARALLILGIALLLTLAGTAKNNPITEAGFLETEDTSCYPCHVTDSPPLRDFFAAVPPSAFEADVGDVFEFSVRVQNIWQADLLEFRPELSLAEAPSLEFASGPTPILDQVTTGTIVYSGTPITPQTSFITSQVPAGASEVNFELTPSNQDPIRGPDLTLNVYPGKAQPEGEPMFSINEAGPGQAESIVINDEAALALAGQTWSVEAVATPVSTAGVDLGAIGTIDFIVARDVYFNGTGEATQALSLETRVPPGASTVLTWALRVLETPASEESITGTINVVSYYKHDDSSTDDFGYTFETIEVGVLAREGGGVIADTDAGQVIVIGDVGGGVSTARVSEVIGYISAFLVLASIYTGGMFGKATRRHQNKIFGTAKRRVGFHNFLSYAIILFATIHMAIFLIPGIEGLFHWTLGLIWGGISILCMFGLGVTGAIQVQMIRKWDYQTWRWTHFGLSIGTIVFTIVHILLDGVNFSEVQNAIGWENPFDPRN